MFEREVIVLWLFLTAAFFNVMCAGRRPENFGPSGVPAHALPADEGTRKFGGTASDAEREAGREAAGARPLIVLFESDPGAEFFAPNTLRFVLYDDRVVVFRSASDFWGYRTVRLTEAEKDELLRACQVDELLRMEGRTWVLIDGVDLPGWSLLCSTERSWKKFCLEGYLMDVGEFEEMTLDGCERYLNALKAVPWEVRECFSYLIHFGDELARLWLPETMEVKFVEFSPWGVEPAAMPDYLVVAKFDARLGGLMTALAAGRRLEDVLDLRRPILYGGRSWVVAAVRFVFPGEEFWRAQRRDGAPGSGAHSGRAREEKELERAGDRPPCGPP